MKTASYKLYAPKCAMKDCINSVNYHKKTQKTDGSWSYKWKMFCDHHRTLGKSQVKLFKKRADGCENRLGIYGFPCGNPDVPLPALEVDHLDGDRYNNDESNLVIVCKVCHSVKTLSCNDHLNRYHHVNKHFDNLYEVVK